MKLLLSFLALLLYSSNFIYSQSPNTESDTVWTYFTGYGQISQMKLSPDNAVIVYGIEADTNYYKLNTLDGKTVDTIRVKHGGMAKSFDFYDNLLAVGGSYRINSKMYIDIYNNKTGDYLFSLTDSNLAFPNYYSFTNLCFSPDGKYLLANIDSNTNKLNVYLNKLYLWDLETKKVVKKIENVSFAGGIISKDSKYIAVRYNGKVGIFDYNTFKLIKSLDHGMNNLCFSPDGKYLATCGNDGYIKIWDINNDFTLWKEYKCETDNDVRYVKFTNDFKNIVFGGAGGIFLSVLEIASNKLVKTYTNCYTFSGIDVSKDNRSLYSASSGKINKLRYSSFTNVPSDPSSNVIYPNPTKQFFTLTLDNTFNADIKVFNNVGQIIFTNTFNNIVNNQITINCQNWVNGTYLIQVNTGNIIQTYKLIKD